MIETCRHFTGLELQALSQLIDMGFSRDDALRALLASAWCPLEAIEFLLGREAPLGGHALPQSEGLPAPSGSAEASSPGGLCNNGCGRTVIHGWATCCQRCRGTSGPHTHTCWERASERPPPAHQPAGMTQPVTVLAVPLAATGSASSAAEESCPVCLEPHTDSSKFGSCQHRICQGCLLLLRQAGILMCPLCRSPASELGPPLPPQVSGYVVLSASTNAGNALGFHTVSWQVLEQRLDVPSGCLAGALGRWGVHLRRVDSQAEAEMWWRTMHTGVMPWRP